MVDGLVSVIIPVYNVEKFIDKSTDKLKKEIDLLSVLLDIGRIGKFQMSLIRSGQDYATWFMLLRDGRIAYGIDEALTQHRRTGESPLSEKTKNWRKICKIQVHYESVKPLPVYFNYFLYAVNALKRYMGGISRILIQLLYVNTVESETFCYV